MGVKTFFAQEVKIRELFTDLRSDLRILLHKLWQTPLLLGWLLDGLVPWH